MIRFISRRFLWGVTVLFLFATIMFFIIQVIIPYDFTVQFALQMNQSQRDQLREELGLNLPLWQQYLNWLKRVFTADLGESFYGYPVAETLKTAIPLTVFVFAIGTALAFMIGFWLGKVTAWRGPGFLTTTATLGGITLYTAFPPWLAWLISYLFARRMNFFRGVFHTAGLSGLDFEIWGETPLDPSTVAMFMVYTVAGALVLLFGCKTLFNRLTQSKWPHLILIPLLLVAIYYSWQLLGFGPQAIDMLQRASLPITTFTLLSFGETMLIMRTSMMDTLKEEYVATAKAKGLPDSQVRDKHAARTALLPVVSRLVISLPYLLTGVVIIEDVFKWPGVGSTLAASLYQQDMPVAMVILLLVGVFSLIIRIALDIIIASLDPRIRIAEAKIRPK
jgi:peptide/nickel transport system permease protein